MSKRVAIIGAGISGLTVAHLLAPSHDVVVYEANDYIGGHTNTIRVDTAYETLHVDTGFIVFNNRNYPNFERLLGRIGVPWQASDMSFSVSDGRQLEYSSGSASGLFANRSHLVTPWFLKMVGEYARFNRVARRLLASSDDPGPSLGHWLEAEGFSRPFIDKLLVPQAAAVWSAPPEQMWTFPARFLVQFFDHHGMLGFTGRPQWRVIRGGSARYVEALTAPWQDRIRAGTPVRSVMRGEDGVLVTAGAEAELERFDEVVFACHSDQALAILGGEATATERELLGAIPFQPNEAVLHTDQRMMPRRRAAWASWNYHLLDNPKPCTTVTYDMNRLQTLHTATRYLVTLNRTEDIYPDRIIRRISYAHPVFTAAGIAAQARVAEISGVNRTHFCGAYWSWGFHEDGVASALRVGREFGVPSL